jgi:hypothetical protein
VERTATELDIRSKIVVLEDVLSENDYNNLYDVVNSRTSFPWYFVNHYHNLSMLDDNNDISTHGFVHNFFDDNTVYSNNIGILDPILNKLAEHFDCPVTPVRMKINMTLNVGKQVQQYPHIDKGEAIGNRNFKTAIFYVNDSDGDTLFFSDKETVVHRQTPRRNSLVVFDGETFHAPQLPLVSQRRLVININVILDR